MTTPPVLSLTDVVRNYPGVRALRKVSFDVQAGTVHALLGENGAGKSTLIRVVSGVEGPDGGTMLVNGAEYTPASPLEALRAGVSTLYQEQNLLPDRTVADNLIMTGAPRRLGLFLDKRRMRSIARDALALVGAEHIDPSVPVGKLSVADRQMVDIARSLHRRSQLLIMDEPTAALSSREVDALFNVVAELPARGVTVLFVSHRLEEIFRICDAVTVVRDGTHVLTAPITELTPDSLVEAMVGEAARAALAPRGRRADAATPVLTTQGLTGPGFHDVDLTIGAGEILALAGVTGSGKEQIGSALLGALPSVHGRVEVRGRALRLTPRRAIAAGVVGVPADRKGEGVIGQLSVRRNLALASLPALSRLGFLSRTAERDQARRRVEELQIKIRDLNVPVAQLSGGNQQKVALGKWLSRPPTVLVLVEPTQGIDIKVRYDFYRLVRDLADRGTGVLLVSSDIPEVLTLADRIVVMRAGTIVGELDGADSSAESVVRLAMGRLSDQGRRHPVHDRRRSQPNGSARMTDTTIQVDHLTGQPDTDTRTHRDLDRQAATLRETIALLAATEWPAEVLDGSRFLFTGCGSSYYAGLSAATLLSTLSGRSAAAAPSSEVWLLPDTYLAPGTVVVGVSRTGTTTEVVRVLDIARSRGLPTVALTLAAEAPVLELADVGVSMRHVGEEGRVMTQSFSNLLMAGQWLAASVAERAEKPSASLYFKGFRQLVDLLDENLPAIEGMAASVAARRPEHFALLGSGPTAAVCSEGVLKLQEMTQIPSESEAALEYRHGPIASLGAKSALILASCPATLPYDVILANDALTLGYRPIALTPTSSVAAFPGGTEVFAFPADLPDWLWPNVHLTFFQYLAWHCTTSLGRDPERVRNLDKTTSPVVDPHVVDLPTGPVVTPTR